MKMTSEKGVELIKEFEGLVLTAYPDPATGGDPWTIGYGHTGPDVKPGLKITGKQADELLHIDLTRFEMGVQNAVHVQLQQHEFDACVSLAFNIGLGNFNTSTLLKKLNEGDKEGASLQFIRWNKAAGKVMEGLTRRRRAEQLMFNGAE